MALQPSPDAVGPTIMVKPLEQSLAEKLCDFGIEILAQPPHDVQVIGVGHHTQPCRLPSSTGQRLAMRHWDVDVTRAVHDERRPRETRHRSDGACEIWIEAGDSTGA